MHGLLASSWQRQQVMAELEVARQKQLHRRTARHLRASIARASDAAEASKPSKALRVGGASHASSRAMSEGSVFGEPASQWMSELMGTVQGRLFLDGLRVRHRRAAGFGGSARRRRGRGVAASIASLPTVGSALTSISENELLHPDDDASCASSPTGTRHSARGSHLAGAAVGAAEDEHDYIMADPDKFTLDKYGFLVPREA